MQRNESQNERMKLTFVPSHTNKQKQHNDTLFSQGKMRKIWVDKKMTVIWLMSSQPASKMIHYSLCFPFTCSQPHLLCSFCLLQLCSPLLLSCFLWQEILTIAGQSFPAAQEAVSLDKSECLALVGVCQQLENKRCCSPPESLCYMAKWT